MLNPAAQNRWMQTAPVGGVQNVSRPAQHRSHHPNEVKVDAFDFVNSVRQHLASLRQMVEIFTVDVANSDLEKHEKHFNELALYYTRLCKYVASHDASNQHTKMSNDAMKIVLDTAHPMHDRFEKTSDELKPATIFMERTTDAMAAMNEGLAEDKPKWSVKSSQFPEARRLAKSRHSSLKTHESFNMALTTVYNSHIHLHKVKMDIEILRIGHTETIFQVRFGNYVKKDEPVQLKAIIIARFGAYSTLEIGAPHELLWLEDKIHKSRYQVYQEISHHVALRITNSKQDDLIKPSSLATVLAYIQQYTMCFTTPCYICGKFMRDWLPPVVLEDFKAMKFRHKIC
ncbi:hypothetical protein WR25_01757 [Diploscapter pachys]|uniref:Mediator of RNA polymerase II transcription subunit 27 n=1 Tax=Diploscapter pachys TaxID=2018661 RepID=A0A2A2JIC2_9BILA|nr:hypothetical protein WR25_01757 [Diploscapter pachys]